MSRLLTERASVRDDAPATGPRRCSPRLDATAAAGDACVTVDREGTITSWNPAAERLPGHSMTAAVGQTLALIIPAEHRARHVATFHEAMDTGTLAHDGTRRVDSHLGRNGDQPECDEARPRRRSRTCRLGRLTPRSSRLWRPAARSARWRGSIEPRRAARPDAPDLTRHPENWLP